jgi:hypothetical protein
VNNSSLVRQYLDGRRELVAGNGHDFKSLPPDGADMNGSAKQLSLQGATTPIVAVNRNIYFKDNCGLRIYLYNEEFIETIPYVRGRVGQDVVSFRDAQHPDQNFKSILIVIS